MSAPQRSDEEQPEHISKFGRTNMSFIEPGSDGRTFSRTATQSSLGSVVGLTCSDDHKVVCWTDIFQPPVVRQYIQNGRLFRERQERTPDRFELFLDLVLVGVVHQLADVALEGGSNGATTAKIVLCFYVCWSIWSDTRTWSNQSGVDDVTQRIQVLAILICLCGFSVNAAAIEVGPGSAAEEAASAAHRFVRRAAEAVTGHDSVGSSAEAAVEHHGRQHAVVAATAFFLVAKLIRIVTYVGYAYWLPDFRSSHLSRVAGLCAVSLVFLGCLIAKDIRTVAIIAGVGAIFEIGLKFTVGIMVAIERHRYMKRQRDSDESELAEESFITSKGRKLPAFNLEHMVERTAAFVTVVLGESIVSLLFTARQGSFGLSDEFARAIFGLTIAFTLNAVFYDSALSRKFTHAIRRHWITHILWDVAHYPLCTGLILSSAALHRMVAEAEASPRATHWQYGGGLAVSLACIAIIGLLHESLDAAGTSRLNQFARALLRFAVALIFALLPLANWSTNLSYLGTNLGVFATLVVFEIWIKLGRQEVDNVDHHFVDADRQEELEERLAAVVQRQSNRLSNDATTTAAGGGPDGAQPRKLRFRTKSEEDMDTLESEETHSALAAQLGVPAVPIVSRQSQNGK
ncbi:hypothetical protein OIV83_001429 [Microbotryomycetes sp. JL201]|nr:hypothetical protein OIV83_001429 [Microbotryomycetes sp. JL201]